MRADRRRAGPQWTQLADTARLGCQGPRMRHIPFADVSLGASSHSSSASLRNLACLPTFRPASCHSRPVRYKPTTRPSRAAGSMTPSLRVVPKVARGGVAKRKLLV